MMASSLRARGSGSLLPHTQNLLPSRGDGETLSSRKKIAWGCHATMNKPSGSSWPSSLAILPVSLAVKKDSAKHQRQVFGIEPNPMGGAFKRENGSKQLTVNILENGDTFEYATTIRKKHLHKKGDEYFDLLYSIEVFEHMPLDRHFDAARFMAGLSRPGTKLILGAGKPGQDGIGHIGGRGREEWVKILENVGFVKNETATKEAAWLMTEFNHKRNTQVYIFQ